jgi:glycosyltransferase involved in cell wall biosynthesis
MKRMIFHHPMPLDPRANSASALRPIKFLEAFQAHGYEVSEVCGYGQERQERIAEVKRRLLAGDRFEFMYSESSTQATLLTEVDHIPRYPFLDFPFFRFCRSRGIRVGLFYRDLYWRFPDYVESVGLLKASVARVFYALDLYCYRKFVDRVYLPSWQMRPYLPLLPDTQLDVLPPGCTILRDLQPAPPAARLRVLYIGGLSSHYRMHKVFAAATATPGVELTVCCREADWNAVKAEYAPFISASTVVVHRSGDALRDLYANCDVVSVLVEPTEYREFAMPFKLFEYIGTGRPIVATRGTLAGDFVAKHSLGWAVEYSDATIAELLTNLRNDRTIVSAAAGGVADCQNENTWFARAAKVIADLSRQEATAN